MTTTPRFETIRDTVGVGQGRADVWLPPGFREDRRWPMVVFLHGYGERGDAGEHVPVGLGPVLRAHPERFPCVVVMPQCPADRVWVSIDRSWARGKDGAEAHVDAAIEVVAARLPIDRERIALTGMSMGGFGVFVYGATRVDRFRSFVAVCGGGHPEDAIRFARAALWVLHGADDDVVPVEESRRMVRAVRAAGGPVRYTEYADLGHACWDRAYADPAVAAFLVGDGRVGETR